MPNVNLNESYINMLEQVNFIKSPSDIPAILGQSFYLQIVELLKMHQNM